MHHIHHMTVFQAIVIGLIQGVGELFPVSSLGHTVLIPSWLGGSWAQLVAQESSPESPYLAFVVGLHLATALVLIGFYLREWGRIVAGLWRSIVHRRISTDMERLAWYIVIATIPVGILGLAFEHQFRVLFAKPVAAAAFLMANGVVLFAGELYRRRNERRAATVASLGAEARRAVTLAADAPTVAGPHVAAVAASADVQALHANGASQTTVEAGPARPRRFRDERIVAFDATSERDLSRIGYISSLVIGASQALALLAGISREGVAMVGGLFRGLSNENALRFSFLLSTPVIFAAGILKVPDLTGPLAAGIRLPVLAGSLAAAASSLLAIVFLTRWFKTRTLVPFAIYCLVFGLISVIHFA